MEVEEPISEANAWAVQRAVDGRGLLSWLGLGLGLSVIYALVFVFTTDAPWHEQVFPAVANSVSLTLLGYCVLRLQIFAPATEPWNYIWHAFIGAGFIILWMSGIAFLDTFFDFVLTGAWSLWWWSGPGLTWQILQGGFVYALVAVGCSHARLSASHRLRAPASTDPVITRDAPPILLVQQEAGLVPMDLAQVIAVEATGDYIKLHRARDTLLIKMTISDAAKRLGAAGFLRVHRSWLVRLEAVSLFEPVGQGRWRALISHQLAVPVSRSGAKLLRPLIF
jgi:LytTr DNA-binding domain